MGKIFLVALAILAVFIYLTLTFLPWYGALLIFVSAPVVAGLAFFVFRKPILKAIFMLPFKAKSARLRGAEMTVKEVVQVPPIADAPLEGAPLEEEAREGAKPEGAPPAPTEPLAYYRLDVVIAPREAHGGFAHWEPGELMVVPLDAAPADDVDAPEDERITCHALEIFHEGRFVAEEGMKYFGTERLRLTIAAPASLTGAKLRYYFEELGSVSLPRDAPIQGV